jgi:CO/xanthine dehydrogenase FAD-binding subunit
MFTIDELLQPSSLEEASAMLTANPETVVLGGCGFLKMGTRRIAKAMDLSRCGLNGIRETELQIELDAMTTLYDIEINTTLNRLGDGVLPKAVGNILGVQFRRCATIGASVYSKYGFSDILPALMVLDTEVELMRAGRMPLVEFMDKPVVRDILLRVIIHKDNCHAAYHNLRNASADFPLVNAAVSLHQGQWRIVGGARPGKVMLAVKASQYASEQSIEQMNATEVAVKAAEELTFGSNNKASAEYRRSMFAVLVERTLEEVLACK